MDAELAADSAPAPATAQGERWTFLAFLRRRPRFLLGYALVLGVAAIGLLSPWLTPYSPVDADSSAYLVSPSLSRPMGTDSAGLDVLSRVMTAPIAGSAAFPKEGNVTAAVMAAAPRNKFRRDKTLCSLGMISSL